MTEKMIPSEKKLMKLDVPVILEKHGDKENAKPTNDKHHQRVKIRRTVKLPRLKLEDLVAQVTEENAHREISSGSEAGVMK